MGGTMRLGAYPCRLTPGSLIQRLYGKDVVSERHRHRYEINNAYREILDHHGFKTVGVWEEGGLIEAMELDGHPFFIGTQFRPEFMSRPNRPHPLFQGFVAAALKRRNVLSGSKA